MAIQFAAFIPAILDGFKQDAQNIFGQEALAKAAETNMLEIERSAAMEEANAQATRERGATAASKQRMKGSALAGAQRTAYAMSGIDASSGTAALTQKSSAVFSELDAEMLKNNAVREAFGHEESARKYRMEADRLWNESVSPEAQSRNRFDALIGSGLGLGHLGKIGSALVPRAQSSRKGR